MVGVTGCAVEEGSGAIFDMGEDSSSWRVDAAVGADAMDNGQMVDASLVVTDVDVAFTEQEQDAQVLRAFSIAEADERIERDCGGCHTEGGTGSSRRLGWDLSLIHI